MQIHLGMSEQEEEKSKSPNQLGPQQTRWYAFCIFSSSVRLVLAPALTAAAALLHPVVWDDDDDERDTGTARPVTLAAAARL